MCGWGVVELLLHPAKSGWNFVFFCGVLKSEVILCLVMCHAMRMYGLLEVRILKFLSVILDTICVFASLPRGQRPFAHCKKTGRFP
jgi:hypothetical protein